jgi:ATP-dependent Clp protease adaptor protein ClpS
VNELLVAVDTPTRTQPTEETRTRQMPPYHVILLNDDHHSMEFVIEVLCKVLGCTTEHAFQLMMEAHHTGRAIIWTGSREVAELKAEQVLSCHEIRAGNNANLGPLGCVVEPAPGA